VPCRDALVAPLVVASDPSHQLLSFAVRGERYLGQEVLRITAAKRGSHGATVQDLDFAGLASAKSEADIGGGQGVNCAA
jgi:hypothetical protein